MTMNLISNIHLAATTGTTPEVGMGVTVCHYSDRNAGTVVAVRTKRDGSVKEIDIRKDKVTRVDSYGMSDAQDYTYEPGAEDAPVTTWRLDSKGRFRQLYTDQWTGSVKMADARHGAKLALGIRDEFYDYTF
jgi:hypothetical protein